MLFSGSRRGQQITENPGNVVKSSTSSATTAGSATNTRGVLTLQLGVAARLAQRCFQPSVIGTIDFSTAIRYRSV